jgi:2-keto-4-pentenoate hydratase
VDLPGETVVLFQDGNKIAEGQGESAMEHPANAVAWLVGKLADRDKGLKAGQLIMTGTLTPILPTEKGSTYVADFSSLGKIEVTFK